MEIVALNAVYYTVEFLKMLITVEVIFSIKIRRQIGWLYLLTVILISLVSYRYEITGADAFVIILIFEIAAYSKKSIGIFALSYVGISFIDMIVASIVLYVLCIPSESIDNMPVSIVINSVSLVMLFVVAAVRKRKDSFVKKDIPYSILVPVIIICFSLSVYITLSQFAYPSGNGYTYRNEFFISILLVMAGMMLVFGLLFWNYRKNEQLKQEKIIDRYLLEQQEQYYHMLLQKEQETRAFRHDMKAHMINMRMMVEQDKYEELSEYMAQMETALGELSLKIITGNSYIDMLINDLSQQYQDVQLQWKGKMPPMDMETMDICSLFYNLLKNAFEAAHEASDKQVDVIVKILDDKLVLLISNHFASVNWNSLDDYHSTKKGSGHGYGVSNIRKCVKKYQGNYQVKIEGNIFETEILFSNMCKKEKVLDERSKL